MLPEVCKEPLLDAYCWATGPMRRRAVMRRGAQGEAPVLVLFYHRVADHSPNDWTISTEQFKAQITWIRDAYPIVSLEDAQKRLASGRNDSPVVAITFDDGYADNCQEALPWLIEQQVPLTYFVATSHTTSGKPFPHDAAAGAPLQPNTAEQLCELARAGVELGAHTRTHMDLGPLDSEDLLHDEIVGSKRDLEAIVDRPVRYFAFPFGMPDNMSELAFRTAFRAGYWGVCSAYGAYNFPGGDSFHIERIHGDPSWARFRNWMTIDPRKVNNVNSFEPGDYRLCF